MSAGVTEWRQSMKATKVDERREQSYQERCEVKVRVIKNGITVRDRTGTYAFQGWEAAAAHIANHIAMLRMERA